MCVWRTFLVKFHRIRGFLYLSKYKFENLKIPVQLMSLGLNEISNIGSLYRFNGTFSQRVSEVRKLGIMITIYCIATEEKMQNDFIEYMTIK